MFGGEGNDSYTVDDVGDKVVENANEGFDTVHSSIDFVLPDHFEKLQLTGSAIQGVGNDGMNQINGNGEDNVLKGLGGNDFLNGGDGNDVIVGGDGHDEIDGGLGADEMWGGAHTDDFIVDNLGDVVHGGTGVDQVWSSVDFVLPDDTEELILTGNAVFGTGNGSSNFMWGNGNANILSGLGGGDQISGFGGDDQIDGGSGADLLEGGNGRDTLTGGIGADRLIWSDVGETGTTTATADVITDFNFAAGDRIDLSAIDANIFAGGDQAFTFIGQAAFSGTPGEINYFHENGNTFIQLQTGNSPDVEAVIQLDGILDPQANWFFL